VVGIEVRDSVSFLRRRRSSSEDESGRVEELEDVRSVTTVVDAVASLAPLGFRGEGENDDVNFEGRREEGGEKRGRKLCSKGR